MFRCTCTVLWENTMTDLKHQCTVLLKKRTGWSPLAQKGRRLVYKLIRGKLCRCPLFTSRDPKPRTKSQHRDSLGYVAEFRYLGTTLKKNQNFTHEEIKNRLYWGSVCCRCCCHSVQRLLSSLLVSYSWKRWTTELKCACCQQLWNLAHRIKDRTAEVPQHSLS